MVGKSETNTLVLEYQGENESTETAFNRVISTLSESAPEITGFRLELTTTESSDIPFEVFVGEQGPSEELEESSDGETATDSSNGSSDSIPSLQSDALPAQVLSQMHDSEEERVRTSELQSEFDDEDIDTARLSQTLASLKRRELVAAEPDPEDKRANLYWPTEKGRKALSD
ncbi:MarR family winged helix-turn-helix transcriptional regulator [Halorussus salinisoli]|uniref:MarR family winged helix-turn-helix transcriptional regulator n=1 Tax=Halorussus salinisoli TaxID=2558242 RepID=UPI0010C1976D|nr:MarR family winged helix-turn-helix transcriptional regulator [Halorussus salinisoli]